MKIYTRTGDKGKTSLFGGKRVPKYALRVEAYGTVDELSSAIGVAIAYVSSSKHKVFNIKRELIAIQHDLFMLGSVLANPEAKPLERLEERVSEFEKLIDEMTEKLPELRNFIFPGGGKVGAMLHLARSICRRCERRLVALAQKEKVDQEIFVYFNRLSDLLFTMARFVNYKEKRKETIWKVEQKTHTW